MYLDFSCIWAKYHDKWLYHILNRFSVSLYTTHEHGSNSQLLVSDSLHMYRIVVNALTMHTIIDEILFVFKLYGLFQLTTSDQAFEIKYKSHIYYLCTYYILLKLIWNKSTLKIDEKLASTSIYNRDGVPFWWNLSWSLILWISDCISPTISEEPRILWTCMKKIIPWLTVWFRN